MTGDLEAIREYWRYADAREAALMDVIEERYSGLSDEIQDIFNRFERLELSGSLPKKEVEALHRKIDRWLDAGLDDSYQLKLYLRDLKNRSRIKGDQALFVWLFAAFAGAYSDILSEDRGLLQDVSEEAFRREYKAVGQLAETPMAWDKSWVADTLAALPDGTSYQNQVYDYVQYAAKRMADTVKMEQQQGRALDITNNGFASILRASRDRLLKRSAPSGGQPVNYHGYLDQTMTAVVGYTVMRVFRESGVERYRFIAVLDGRTTDACRWLNGKIFKVADGKPGENVPPVTIDHNGKPVPHPCRSIIRAVFSDRQITKAMRSSGGGGQSEPHTYKQLGTIDFNDKRAVNSLIDAFIKQYADSKRERCLVIAEDGTVYMVYGDETTADTSILGDKMRGSVNIHNHPVDKTQYSFSHDDDLSSFYEDGSAVMMAFDDRYIYEIRRPERMPPREEFDRVIWESYHDRWKILVRKGIAPEDARFYVEHAVVEKACSDLGIYYKRWEKK